MKKAYIVALILIAIFFVSITGCSSVGDKIAEKTAEGIAEQTLGGKVDITKDGVKVDKDGVSFETGQDLKWPKGTMGDLPEPKAKISAVLNSEANADKGCTVAVSKMSVEDAKAYVEKIKELGYKDGLSLSDTDMISYSGKNSSGASVMFTYSVSPMEGTIIYTLGGTN